MNDNERALLEAAAAGDSGRVRKLVLMKGVNINAVNEDGFTAFNLATMNGQAETATTILALKKALYHKKIEQERESKTSIANAIKKRKRKRRA